jgi:hypothetical protein
MTINNKTVGPATYLSRVSELIGREADPGPALLAYGRGVSAELYVAQPHTCFPPNVDEPVILRPFTLGPLSSIPCRAGAYLGTLQVQAELKRLGIPFEIQA